MLTLLTRFSEGSWSVQTFKWFTKQLEAELNVFDFLWGFKPSPKFFIFQSHSRTRFLDDAADGDFQEHHEFPERLEAKTKGNLSEVKKSRFLFSSAVCAAVDQRLLMNWCAKNKPPSCNVNTAAPWSGWGLPAAFSSTLDPFHVYTVQKAEKRFN